ncbi:hypothetical protein BCR42DRAFT_411373 [Absidia repens]|uniref:F-box domain-containing protein n=1 Tax=Absidia repens TaxID=90262 RepID=A0A1X2ILM3_9FUNG|nr:hypothetical protein BCR42DRAFT_411373 [Absidia repens]
MKSILLFPSEIIEIICSYLSGSDYCTCLSVSSSWYDIFIQHLYRNLTIHGEQHLEQVCRNLLHHAPVYLGNSVRTINLRIESISNRHLSQLGAWCIFVESLSLRWSIWNEDELQQTPQKDGDEIAKRKEQFPSIMASFIGPFMNLTRLSLDVSFGKQEITLPDFIPFLPRLTSLTVANGTHLSFEYLECIHKMCPSIEHLSLQGTFIGQIPSITRTATAETTTVDGIEGSNTTPIVTLSDIKPATRLFTIELVFVSGGYEHYSDWLLYFGMKYPNLVSFEFRQYGPPSTSAVLGPQQVNSSMYDCVFTHLATGCPLLSDVSFYNIHLHPSFFDKMCQSLRHVSLHLPLFPTTSYLSSLFHHHGLQQHLTSLDLSIPLKKDNSNNDPQLLSSDLFGVLGQLYNLTTLTLRGGKEVTCIHLDLLLQTFNRLTQLTLVGLKLGLQQQRQQQSTDDNANNSLLETTVYHPNDFSTLRPTHTVGTAEDQQKQIRSPHYPLESLTLRGISLMDPWYLFPWVNDHMELSYLTLAQSCRSISTLTNQAAPCTIWLPDTRLKKFVANERRHQKNPTRLYLLHQTMADDMNDGRHWPRETDDYWPRFTDVDTNACINGDKHIWYILQDFDPEQPRSGQLAPLKSDQNFEWVVTYHSIKSTCPWYAEFCDAAEDVYKKQDLTKNKVDDIDGVEYMKIVCRSIGYLEIYGQRLSFAD